MKTETEVKSAIRQSIVDVFAPIQFPIPDVLIDQFVNDSYFMYEYMNIKDYDFIRFLSSVQTSSLEMLATLVERFEEQEKEKKSKYNFWDN